MLADAGLRGCTGADLLAHGFNMDVIADLVLKGFATENQETMRVGGRKIQVARVRIMDAGRRELEGDSPVRKKERAVQTQPCAAPALHAASRPSRAGASHVIPVPHAQAAAVQRHARQEAASAFGQGQKTDRFRYISRDTESKVSSR
jgi:hypothetical protein